MADINGAMSLNELPGYVRKSFRGSIRKVRLKPGTKLYVLSSKKHITKGQVEEINPWWSVYDRFRDDHGYAGRVKIAGSSGQALHDLLKDTAAYDGKKAGGRYVVVGKTRVPVWGFYGVIRRKGENTPGQHGLKRAYQIYVPNLNDHAIRRATVHDIF